MKIVIVDDDIFVSGALTTILEASGKLLWLLPVQTERSCRIVQIHQPDVLLMDIRMKEKAD